VKAESRNEPAETRPWFMWGERPLTFWERLRLLLGEKLYVRFDAPSGRCSAACELSHCVSGGETNGLSAFLISAFPYAATCGHIYQPGESLHCGAHSR